MPASPVAVLLGLPRYEVEVSESLYVRGYIRTGPIEDLEDEEDWRDPGSSAAIEFTDGGHTVFYWLSLN